MKKTIAILIIIFSLSIQALSPNSIKRYVKQAPIIKNHEQLDTVIQYLKQKYTNNKDLALAILIWITLNIDYDLYTYKQTYTDNQSFQDLSQNIPKHGDIIQSRLGINNDIAQLYEDMLNLAGIPAQTIFGCIGSPHSKSTCLKNPHTWNAVWIDNKWELVDPTFSMKMAGVMGNVKNKYQYRQAIKKRNRLSSDIYNHRKNRPLNTSWFMTNPQKMKKDHHPKDKRWYLNTPKGRKSKTQ